MDQGIEKLSSTIDDFSHYIEKLPKSDVELSKTSEWGPKEVLIHLVAWHEYYCKIIHSLVVGHIPILIKGTLKNQNRLAVENNKNETVKNLLLRLEAAEVKLENMYKSPNAKNLYIALKVGGKIRPLHEIVKMIPRHIINHQLQLQKAGFVIK